MTPPTELTSAAVHEAGHAVVAYALGRRVTLIRIGRQLVPGGHPHADLLAGSVSGGETRFAPELGAEISQRSKAGSPLSPEHVGWLRAELVTCFGGERAETRLLGTKQAVSAQADLQQAAIVIRLLGMTADADGGEARLERAIRIADRLIAELHTCVVHVAAALSHGPCELDEATAHSLLERAGVHAGSHQTLLVDLAA